MDYEKEYKDLRKMLHIFSVIGRDTYTAILEIQSMIPGGLQEFIDQLEKDGILDIAEKMYGGEPFRQYKHQREAAIEERNQRYPELAHLDNYANQPAPVTEVPTDTPLFNDIRSLLNDMDLGNDEEKEEGNAV